MYSSFQLAKKYLHYLLTASNGKGHGIHSPFVFEFMTKVAGDKQHYDLYEKIERVRQELLHNHTVIEVEDHGAGSSLISSDKRKVNDIARSSVKNKKIAQLLFRIVKYYNPQTILELGTSFGITTGYLATANPLSTVYTLEGAKNIAGIALNNFDALGLKNVRLIQGNFDVTLPVLLQKINKVDLAFVDGNHRKFPTINYFNWLLQSSTYQSVFIFDDIHWSADMEEAWKYIQQSSVVTLTIDLFFIGLVFFNKDFKVPQHFVVRF